MSNFEHSRQEHTEEPDPGIEMVDLEPSEPTDTLDKFKRDLLARIEKNHSARPFLLKQGKVQLAALSGIVLVGLIVVLSASGTFSFLLSHVTHPSASPSSGVLLLEQNTLRCFVDTAWSPDNQHIAVLGYGVDCQHGSSPDVPGLVNVYNGHSAQLLAQLHPDAVILSTLKKQFKQFAGQQVPPIINYQTILWSPDGQYLALLFVAATSPNLNVPVPRIDGVFLLGKDDKQHVFLRQETPEEANFLPQVWWDIHQGVATVVPNPAISVKSNRVISISTSLSYHWGAGDVLVPDTQTGNASPSAPALSPVGNPDGESSFSIWQPGYIFYFTRGGGNGSLYVPGAYVWQTFFPAWSPDGRFLVEGLVAEVRLEVPDQKSLGPQALKDLGVDQLHVLQVHNKALVQVLHTLLSLPDTNDINVSWRPDGRVLAMYNAGQVDIYDCATGRKLSSLVPATSPDRMNGIQDVLRWSPDGTHLLLFRIDWGPMQLWGPGQLPK